MYILGISAFYHDSAATLVRDGEIICAAQEERFTRIKGDRSLPINSIKFCCENAGIDINDIEHVVFYENTTKKFGRLIKNALFFSPKGLKPFQQAMSSFIGGKLKIPSIIQKKLNYSKDVFSIDHHLSHASSAFYPSPYKDAAVLTLDGVGEWATVTIGKGEGNNLELIKELHFPHSLGMLYSAFTYYTGFKVNSGEYKLMGLAPYGENKYVERILDHIVSIRDDGSFQVNMDYFSYCTDFKMVNKKFCELFEGEPRSPESDISQKEMDIARSIQTVLEKIVLRLARTAKALTNLDHLCLPIWYGQEETITEKVVGELYACR